jgi:hypothetical protein
VSDRTAEEKDALAAFVAHMTVQVCKADQAGDQGRTQELIDAVYERYREQGMYALCWGLAEVVLYDSGLYRGLRAVQDQQGYGGFVGMMVTQQQPDGTEEWVNADEVAAQSPEDKAIIDASRFVTAVGNQDVVAADTLFVDYAARDDSGLVSELVRLAGQTYRPRS